MTLKQARALRKGARIAAIIRVPRGGESRWNVEEEGWDYTPIEAGQVMVFQGLVPKVRVVRDSPWQDGHRYMLLCETLGGGRAWLNIRNAVSPKGGKVGVE